jgi:hypothetical protein
LEQPRTSVRSRSTSPPPGIPELVAKLEDIRAVIDLEIACLEPDDLSQPHRG